MPKKFDLRKLGYTYVKRNSPDFDEDKNNQLIDFLEKQVEQQLDFKTISFKKFLIILYILHKITMDENDVADRRDVMSVFNHDYELLIALNYKQTLQEAQIGGEQVHYLHACGFKEKAESHLSHSKLSYIGIEVMKTCLTQHSEQEIMSAIEENRLEQLARDCIPDEYAFERQILDQTNPTIDKHFHAAHRLEMYNTTKERYHKLQRLNNPIFRMFVHTRFISQYNRLMFANLQKGLNSNVDVRDIAADTHCEYIGIHPKVGSTKRVARALMTLILMTNGIQPICFESETEIDIYYYALKQKFSYDVAAEDDSDKSDYNPTAFRELIKNKIHMTSDEFNAWIANTYPGGHCERAFQIALKYFGSVKILYEKCCSFELFLPTPEFVGLPSQLTYAKERAKRTIANSAQLSTKEIIEASLASTIAFFSNVATKPQPPKAVINSPQSETTTTYTQKPARPKRTQASTTGWFQSGFLTKTKTSDESKQSQKTTATSTSTTTATSTSSPSSTQKQERPKQSQTSTTGWFHSGFLNSDSDAPKKSVGDDSSATP